MSDDKKVIFSMSGVTKAYQNSQIPVLKNIYLSFFYGAKIGILGPDILKKYTFNSLKQNLLVGHKTTKGTNTVIDNERKYDSGYDQKMEAYFSREKNLCALIFDLNCYNLNMVGRINLNHKLNLTIAKSIWNITLEDIFAIINYFNAVSSMTILRLSASD